MPIPERIQRFLAYNKWKSLMQSGDLSIHCVYVGKYKEWMVFEADETQQPTIQSMNDLVGFKVFLPYGYIEGQGTITKRKYPEPSALKMNPVFIGVRPERMQFAQKRRFKRFYMMKPAVFIAEGVRIRAMLLDLSFYGMGVMSDQQILSNQGVIQIPDYSLELPVTKCHEAKQFDFFYYGFSIPFLNQESKKRMADLLSSFQKAFQEHNLKLG